MAARKEDKAAETSAKSGRQATGQAAEFAMGTERLAADQAHAYRELTDFSRDDVDALMQSSARLAKSMQDMGFEVMQFAQNSMRIGFQAASGIMGCRTVDDLVQVQRDFLRESVGSLLQESAKLLEMTTSATTEAANPINERVQEGTRH